MHSGPNSSSPAAVLTLDDRFVANPVVLCVRNEGDAVLLNTLTGRYYGLNPVGTDVWDAILDGLPLREIVASVSAKYSTAESHVIPDVLRLVDKFTQQDLVARGA